MHAPLAMALKDLRLLLRDRVNFFFTFFFPLLFGLFFGMIFKGAGDGPRPVRVALLVEDTSPRAQEFAGELRRAENITVVDAPDRGAGEAMVRRREVLALLVLPEGFGAGFDGVFEGERGRIEGVVDPSRAPEAGMLQGALIEHAFRSLTSSFQSPERFADMTRRGREALAAADVPLEQRLLFNAFFGAAENLVRQNAPAPAPSAAPAPAAAGFNFTPVEVHLSPLAARPGRAVPANSFTLTIPQSIVWGLMGCVVAFAVSLAEERQRGTLMRLSVAPLPPWKVLAGKALACFITGVAVQVFLITVGVTLLGVRVADWPMLALAVVVAAFAFTGVMTLLAALGRSEAGASGVGRAAMLLLAMLGGGAVPLMFMPGWMQTLASISPFKWALLAVEGAVWRGSTPLEMAMPLGVLLGAGVVCLTIGAIVLERTRTA